MNGESSCGFSLRANHAAAGFPRQPTECRLPDGKLSSKNKWEEGGCDGCDPKSAGKLADRGSATRSSFVRKHVATGRRRLRSNCAAAHRAALLAATSGSRSAEDVSLRAR